MKYMVFLLLAVLGAEVVYLSQQRSEIVVDQSVFTSAIERQQQHSARERLLWLQQQMLERLTMHDVQSWLDLAAFYDLYGYQEEATAVYHVAQQIDPNSYDAFQACGSVAVKLGRHAHADRYFKQALERASDERQRGRSHYRLGLLALRLEDAEGAALHFNAAVDEIQFWPALYERLRLALHRGEQELFLRLMPQLRERYRRSTEVYHLHLRAEERFERYQAEGMHELASRRSMLYLEFDAEAESRTRAQLGLNINEIFDARLAARDLQRTVTQLGKDAEAIGKARQLFQEAQCVFCHGPEGRGQVGPNLLDDYWIHGSSPYAIYKTISDGKQHMPAMKFKLSSEQLQLLTAYIIDLNLRTEKNSDGTAAGKGAQGQWAPLKLDVQ